MKDVAAVAAPPEPRAYHGFNWAGFWTLYSREVRRFWKVGVQTIAGPVVTALLYMMVFVVAVQAKRPIHGVSYGAFVAPGLIMMQILSNAFANSSSSIIQSKMNGLTGDFLTPPLTALEQAAAFSLGGATRGAAVGIVTWLAVLPFAPAGVAHLWAVVFFGFTASLILSLLGVVAGLWSEKFDHIAAVTSFIVVPMTFLSGTFYLVERLPEPFRTFSAYNPIFYMIDGFRYGFVGQAEASVGIGLAYVSVLAVALWLLCLRLFQVGYHIKT